MKNAVVTLILGLLIVHAGAQKPVHLDVDNIYCIGNGKLAAYFSKADMLQLFGAPYSSPNIMEMILNDRSFVVDSKREAGTAIWSHRIRKGDVTVATITDFIDAENPTLIRQFEIVEPISFSLSVATDSEFIPNQRLLQDSDLNEACLIEAPRGKAFYNDYPMPFRQYIQMLTKGSVSISEDRDEIICTPGIGYLYIVGGPLYPDCIKNTKSILSKPVDTALADTREWWQEFSSRRVDFKNLLPEHLPNREKLLQTIDDVAINIKTQQAFEGGVLAGHNYHMGYVRDQYGVSRCLLKLGYLKEAKDILNFYWKVWQKQGQIKNAQGLGIDAFHVHENDEVEITGYFIIQAFDYLEKSKDLEFVKEIRPMLEWAWACQCRNLKNHMLPFNGDETYVAGGILPRSALNDGSAEATLLFLTSGNKLLPWLEKNAYWNADKLEKNNRILKNTEERFRENFFIDGILYANNPERTQDSDLPQFRHGVCELGTAPGCKSFGWTQKNENNRYLCSVCSANHNMKPANPQRFNIQSVSLVPQYIGASLLKENERLAMLDKIVALYQQTGKLPSRPDGNITVGYDYGLFLYNLSAFNHPLSEEIYTNMLSVLDKTGSWVEYYDLGKPKGTRYRPWESAINLEAAIEFGLNYK